MKKVSPPLNIEIPETVKREADRLAEDPDAILRLVDLLFFRRGDDGRLPPSYVRFPFDLGPFLPMDKG